MDDSEESVLIGGTEMRRILIVDYDPEWPRRFEAERARIQAALGADARRIDHIGSTSVPGLAAKPIIDVNLTVGDFGDVGSYDPALVRVGYVLRVRESNHRMYRTPAIDTHVHLWAGDDLRRHLLFRDWLRDSADDRLAYERLKRSLAARAALQDTNEYARAKGGFIDAAMQRAEAWALLAGWDDAIPEAPPPDSN